MAVYIKTWLVLVALLFVGGACKPAFAEEGKGDGRIKLYVRAHDPQGYRLSFKWIQLDGPEAKIIDANAATYDDKSKKWTSEPYFIPSKAGTYTFQVTVKNEEGAESRKTFVLEAKKGGTE